MQGESGAPPAQGEDPCILLLKSLLSRVGICCGWMDVRKPLTLNPEPHRCGVGTLKWKDGSSYEGEWHNDEPHGLGIERMSDGSFYIGQFWKDEREGWGMVRWAWNPTRSP